MLVSSALPRLRWLRSALAGQRATAYTASEVAAAPLGGRLNPTGHLRRYASWS